MLTHSIRRTSLLLTLLAILVLMAGGAVAAHPASSNDIAQATNRISAATFRSSPVMFIENAGQWPDAARFQVWGAPAGTMWLAEDAIWITVVEQSPSQVAGLQVDRLRRFSQEPSNPEPATFQPKAVNIKLSFVGANPHARIEPFDRLDTVVSYFIGNDPERWRPGVPVWGGVRYVDLYPGVDLEITSEGGQMVQRLDARPDADLSPVRLRVEGADAVDVKGNALRLNTAVGEVAWPLLLADGLQADRFKVEDPRIENSRLFGAQAVDVAVPFAPANPYQQSQVADPQSVADNPTDLLYGTFLGGSSHDWAGSIAVDRSEAAYSTGMTDSTDFPTTPGAFDRSYNGGSLDAFVVKLNPTGSGLAYATFLGGSYLDWGHAIAVDAAGNAYVTGGTSSSDFPTTPGAFDRSYNGGDAFVVKLNAAGNGLAYATFLGGSSSDQGHAIAVDAAGSAYVAGDTLSSDFPTTPGAFDRGYNGGDWDAFVVKLAMGVVPTYTISGRVTDANGHGIPGVTVWAGFPRNTTTDANGNYTFAGLSAGTYNLRAEKAGYAICPHTRQVTLPPDASGQNFTGLPATASLGFCPSSDGYKFSNSDSGWGSYPAPPAWGDLTMADTRRMCGDQAVCLSPWLPGLPCAYKLSAETWNFIVNLGMIKGHCAGMAATSLRFFKDIDQPSDFQAGASTTFALDLLGETRRNIAYYQAEQSALPILSYKLQQQHTSTPVQTLSALQMAMAGDVSDPVVLVLKSGENQHAVTPIALEDRGNGIWAVWVYDNELPGSASTVMINTLNNTWSRGSWSGDASSHSLYVIAMSLFNGEQTCPFSLSPVTAATLSSESPNGQIWLTENANLLITDSLGRRLGYVGDQLVSEIPGADRIDFIVGTSHPAIPVYSIPLTETYTMLLDGHPLAETQTLQIAQFGPGYAASIENVLVSPTTRDHLAIAADGSQLQYRASTGKEATLKLAQDGTNESYQLSLHDVEIYASKTITLTNNTSTGRLVFANSPGTSNSYDLVITRATATTGAKRFYHADLTANPGDVQSFDYGAWDGSGSLVMQIDHNGDGVIDETQLLENQIKRIYLPLVFRK